MGVEKLENKNQRKTFYKNAAKLIGGAPGTAQNKFSKKKITLKPNDFKNFYNQATVFFKKEIPDEEFQIKRDLFNQWIVGINKSHKSKLPHESINISNDEGQSPFTYTNLEKDIHFILAELNSFYDKFPKTREYFMESWAFAKWRNALNDRLNLEEVFNNHFPEDLLQDRYLGSETSSGLQNYLEYQNHLFLQNNWFEIFTRENEKIASRKINIGTHTHLRNYYESGLNGSYFDEEIEIGKRRSSGDFYYDLRSRLLIFYKKLNKYHPYNLKKHNPAIEESIMGFVFIIPHVISDFYKGYMISVSHSSEIKCTLAVCKEIENKENRSFNYSEHNFDTYDISFKIKSFLKETENDYPKGLMPEDAIIAIIKLLGLAGKKTSDLKLKFKR
ncbi:hypothetical protein A3860_33770 [Niastella vici]|uniref:Uncharacterized protein n=2 Tax=Niastella vici TaxID=1703345 RepID=A0A1V9FPU7_9BACT|nr:hypothetical protein A3860_33770 [Niastella vici]